MQSGAETGVPGLLLWVSLLLSNILIPLRLGRRIPHTWRRGNSEQRFVAAASFYLPLAQIGFAVTAFFVSFAWMEPLYMLSAIVAGLNLVVRRQRLILQPAVAGPGFRTMRAVSMTPPLSLAPPLRSSGT